MAFFPNSSGFAITGGHFTINLPPTQDAVPTQKRKERDNLEFDTIDEPRKRRRCSIRNSDGLKIVKGDEVELHRELNSGNNYRIHSASHEGRFAVVKTFEGSHAKQDWKLDVDFYSAFFHSNVLKIIGVSDENSKRHFSLFHGIASEQKMQSLIAKALRTDLNTSVQLSMKAVKGIAAGLNYIESLGISVHAGTTNNNQKWEDFDIFVGYDNEPVISFNTTSTAIHEDEVFDIRTDDRGVEVLIGLCQKLFSGVNSILYDDSPERQFDILEDCDKEDLLSATIENMDGYRLSSSEAKLDPSKSTEKPKSRQTPRREVWCVNLGATNQSLKSIKQSFEDRLDRFPLSPGSLLCRIRSRDKNLRRNLHRCPGYLREEIVLTSEVSQSAIVSHAFPGESELCSICGQLVQYV